MTSAQVSGNWPAIFRGPRPISATVTIPGSKSVTNRALILAAQATTPSLIRRPLISRDSELMVAGLRELGISIVETAVDGDAAWQVTPAKMNGPAKIDVGNACFSISVFLSGPAHPNSFSNRFKQRLPWFCSMTV